MTVFSHQTSAIKKTCYLMELGNLKLPLAIFRTGTVVLREVNIFL